MSRLLRYTLGLDRLLHNLSHRPQKAPLCTSFLHQFQLVALHNLLGIQRFIRQCHNYEEIDNVPDRLRWCRLHLGPLQREVVERVGTLPHRFTST